MHLSLAITGDNATKLDDLAEQFAASPPAVAKAILVAVLTDGLAEAVLDGNQPVKRERSVPWGTHEDDQLERMRAEGKSYSEIARALRRTRSSVIGRAHRKGLCE